MNIYDKLKKIKRPVLIEVEHRFDDEEGRYRIVHPNGRIEFDYNQGWCNGEFVTSCFSYHWMKLNDVINRMKDYDKQNGLRIKKIIQL